ncbi:MAG: YqjF family protein [Ilumatobacteraceae bacterium]
MKGTPMRVMTQDWQHLLFAHWSYEPDMIRGLLPPQLAEQGVELDTFEGRAYVGLVPFQMRNLRLRGLPPIPTTADFPEVNVRTYVTHRGRPAVWFFSLDTPQILPTLVARTAFRLPYCWSRASVTVTGSTPGSILASSVERRWPGRATSTLAARIGEPVSPTPLTEFLTARWGLVATASVFGRQPSVWYGPVEHEPWHLHRAHLLDLDDHLLEAAGLPAPQGEPLLHYSAGVSTTVFSLERLSRADQPPI